MASDAQIALLKQGVMVWNAWRNANQDVEANLSGAHLSGANLSRANLSRADLSRANLSEAHLSRADLSRADLSRADLSRAHLIRANLSRADLNRADLNRADLDRAKLNEADLSRANLSGANLIRANLSRAHLNEAHLSEANLSGVDLSGADLSGADLSRAHLSEANLSGADLSLANLSLANLSRAHLSEANLSRANLFETVFANINLTETKGLDQCMHHGPSIIDHRTLQNSGPLPLVFLRGVGLPDNMIDYLPSLLSQPIQFYSCFISYSHKDEAFVQRLYADLQNKGIRCWYAPENMKWGDKIWDTIDEAIRLRDKVLIVLSENSIASDWVEDEISKAFAEERDRKRVILFPIRLDNAVLQTPEPWARKLRDQRLIGDFRQWKDHDAYQKALQRLLRDLKIEQSEGLAGGSADRAQKS